MSNNFVDFTPNFQAGDSPKTIDIKTALGVCIHRSSTFINAGPGTAQIELSFDAGFSFETPIFITPALAFTGGALDPADQIRVTHIGRDFDFIVTSVASDQPLLITPIPAPEIYFVGNYLSQPLLDSAANNMAIDGSVTPVEYSFTVATSRRIRVSRGSLMLEDGNLEFSPGDFGRISGALANGVEISITPDGGSPVVIETWATNRDIRDTLASFDPQFRQDGAYVGSWEFTADLSGGKGLYLNDGDKFSMTIQDDLTPLDFMSFTLHGRIINV